MVYGDSRGSAAIRNRRGETHVESVLECFYAHTWGETGASDIVTQLRYVVDAHRRQQLVIVVSDEPDVTPALDDALTLLGGRHELLWLMITDLPALGSVDGERDGFDVATGRFVLNGTMLGPRVLAAYQAAEARRAVQLDEFLTAHGVRFARIGASREIRMRLLEMSEGYRHAN